MQAPGRSVQQLVRTRPTPNGHSNAGTLKARHPVRLRHTPLIRMTGDPVAAGATAGEGLVDQVDREDQPAPARLRPGIAGGGGSAPAALQCLSSCQPCQTLLHSIRGERQ